MLFVVPYEAYECVLSLIYEISILLHRLLHLLLYLYVLNSLINRLKRKHLHLFLL